MGAADSGTWSRLTRLVRRRSSLGNSKMRSMLTPVIPDSPSVSQPSWAAMKPRKMPRSPE